MNKVQIHARYCTGDIPVAKARGLSSRTCAHTPRGTGGGTLIFSHKRRFGSFWGFEILNFIILGGFRKITIFGGMKILWIFLGGHHKIGIYLGVNSIHFMVFSLGQCTEWGISFGVGKI